MDEKMKAEVEEVVGQLKLLSSFKGWANFPTPEQIRSSFFLNITNILTAKLFFGKPTVCLSSKYGFNLSCEPGQFVYVNASYTSEVNQKGRRLDPHPSSFIMVDDRPFLALIPAVEGSLWNFVEEKGHAPIVELVRPTLLRLISEVKEEMKRIQGTMDSILNRKTIERKEKEARKRYVKELVALLGAVPGLLNVDPETAMVLIDAVTAKKGAISAFRSFINSPKNHAVIGFVQLEDYVEAFNLATVSSVNRS